MSDVGVSYSDFNRLERRVSAVEHDTAVLAQMAREVSSNIEEMKYALNEVMSGVEELKNDFITMMIKQDRDKNVQLATTELVRLKQELEQKYGSYRVVRETMLGVLQATDLKLVTQSTISRVSEEIMIQTPEYWLAPCLIAVSAWIGNNRDLAERAIEEALKRDKQKTSITMALICRRNGRTKTCYEWLNLFFSTQDPSNFSESSFAYVDAYINGIFGPDEQHICDDYISKWMSEIKGASEQFEKEQQETWRQYCERFARNIAQKYPLLYSNTNEYGPINDYLGRTQTVNVIAEEFTSIRSADVNTEILKKRVDENLMELIQAYDRKEGPIRDQLILNERIIRYNGDKERALEEVENERHAERTRKLNLVDQMTNAIMNGGSVAPSQRKTAVSFLSGYIRKGYSEYINEKREAFPQAVTIRVEDWQGVTSDGSNLPALYQDYANNVNAKKEAELANCVSKLPIGFLIGAGIAFVLMIVFFVNGVIPMGIIGLLTAGGLVGGFFGKKASDAKSINARKAEITTRYDEQIQAGYNVIHDTAQQWLEARQEAYNFSIAPELDVIMNNGEASA